MQNKNIAEPGDWKAIIVGGGPAGLMAAEVLSQGGVRVELYEAKPWSGRKFLVAGKGGLNITHSEPFDEFIKRYGNRKETLKPMLEQFGPKELQTWVHNLGFTTFIGSSGRVFPEGMKSSPLLRAWITRLSENKVRFFYRHRWLGWGDGNRIIFDTENGEVEVDGDVLILALGGGSRPELGSDAGWIPILADKGVKIHPLKPANCGFNLQWSEVFRSKFEGQPVKNVSIYFKDNNGIEVNQRGEFIISQYGVEGSLIYAVSSFLRDEIEKNGTASIHLDLLPDKPQIDVEERLAIKRGKNSLSSHLRKRIGLDGVKAGLLREMIPVDETNDPKDLAARIKRLPITLNSARPLAEAISSAGGVTFESLTDGLMIKNLPGVFCAGEMLDWEAPTGGYLLTACFATGYHAGRSAVEYLEKTR
ncbi:MAG TPA: TIGR03862 family flavoprotein [Anaerolineales bacterium]|nr:TIGR03862 family flavoprotein [Anaerolineales bacterium]